MCNTQLGINLTITSQTAWIKILQRTGFHYFFLPWPDFTQLERALSIYRECRWKLETYKQYWGKHFVCWYFLVGAIKVRHEPVNYPTGLIAPPCASALQLPAVLGVTGVPTFSRKESGNWAESKQTSEHCGAVKISCGFYWDFFFSRYKSQFVVLPCHT